MSNWKKFIRKGHSEMRPYIFAEDMTGISVSDGDVDEIANPDALHGMVARNPDDHGDQWYVNAKYFCDNFMKSPV